MPELKKTKKRPDPQILLRKVVEFNEAHPVGTPVRYWKGIHEGEGIESRTRTPALLIGGHTPAVWIEGQGSCIALTHIKVCE